MERASQGKEFGSGKAAIEGCEAWHCSVGVVGFVIEVVTGVVIGVGVSGTTTSPSISEWIRLC